MLMIGRRRLGRVVDRWLCCGERDGRERSAFIMALTSGSLCCGNKVVSSIAMAS